MLNTMEKMYIITKKTLAAEYGEQFTGLAEEAQAAIVTKVLADLMKRNHEVAGILGGKYLEEIA